METIIEQGAGEAKGRKEEKLERDRIEQKRERDQKRRNRSKRKGRCTREKVRRMREVGMLQNGRDRRSRRKD